MENPLERIFWNGYARSYDNLAKHFHPYQGLVKEVCDHVDAFAQGRSLQVLDAGCGTGNYAWELANRGHKVVGVDSSLAMLAQAQRKGQAVSGKAKFLWHDLSKPLPFEDNSFDAAICVMVLYSLGEPGYLLSELKRVTSGCGRFVAVTMQKKVDFLGTLTEAYEDHGAREAARIFVYLFGVGIFNLIINAKHRMGIYSTMNELPDEPRGDANQQGLNECFIARE